MRGRQLGSNTGRGELSWGRTGRECTSGFRRAQAGQNKNKTLYFQTIYRDPDISILDTQNTLGGVILILR